ncbi:hypothetical protein AVEN_60034-1 [Araneus ventricosus]|uniref:Uncharacterized protein n=1 Tax=Araneus ventricosus TaxID=182803 RepID=A0A4Y2CE79_ARAVE|nr:hypothetical protein AVEN_60034-1 [Araneus ventricosus]
MVIGSLDRKVTLQKTKAAERKLKQERYEKRNKTLSGVSSSSMDLNNECKLKGRMCEHLDLSAPSAIAESGAQRVYSGTPGWGGGRHFFPCLHAEKRNVSQQSTRIDPQNADNVTVTPVVTKFSATARTLDQFGISDRAGAAIVSAELQDVGIIS